MQKQLVNIQLDEQLSFFDKKEFDLKKYVKKETQKIEKPIIKGALKKFNGNKSKTARFLKIDYKTLLNKLKIIN